MSTILEAANYFAEAHNGQVRKVSGLPYFDEHSLKAAILLSKYKESKHFDEIFIALLGHDSLEDTKVTFLDLAAKFSPLSCCIIQECTNDEKRILEIGKKAYFMEKMPGMSNYGLIAKLLDRLINVSDAPKIQYVHDTIEIIFHLKKVRQLTNTQLSICMDILAECWNQIEKTKGE